MRPFIRPFVVTAAIVAAAGVVLPRSATALSADLAKKCRDLAIKAHPTATAGSTTGSGAAQRGFYQACLAKGGNVDSGSASGANSATGPNSASDPNKK
jgi:hypothetical protein